MKRKIALLLAFAMVFSTLPMSVAGNTGGFWGSGNRTGMMWEQTGPTSNLRHWGDGVLVTNDEPGRAAMFAGATRNLADAPGGVHRHIGVALDYFRGRENVSSTAIRVDISNAHSWAIGHGAGLGERGYMTFANNTAPIAYDLGAVLIDAGLWSPGFAWGNPPAGTAPGWRYGQLALALAQGHDFQPGQHEAYVARLTAAFANRAAVTYVREAQGDSVGYFAVTLIPMGRRWAELILVNLTPGTTGSIAPNDATFIPVPIEYVTQGSTNDNPVFLTFTQQTGWPEAGTNNRRTYLTTTAQNRFTLTADNVRRFHRYARADLGWVRIAEAAQGAFDYENWYIQLDVITPGFAWARQSINTTNVSMRHGVHGAGPATVLRSGRIFDRSARDTGNNDRYTLAVGLPNARTDGRTVMDWLNIDDLYIVATDRARDGDVMVELTLWRATNEGAAATTGNWTWNVIQADGSWVPDHVQTNEWLEARFTVAARTTPMVPPNPHLVTSRPFSSVEVPAGGYGGASAAGDYTLEWRWTPAAGAYGAWRRVDQDHVFRDTFVAARFGSLGLEFFVHEDYDADDHWLRSGAMEWDIALDANNNVSHRGYVVDGSPNPDYHRTVRTVLRETVPGSLPATGAHPTTFNFPEGIQILGARFWTNDADFVDGHNDIDDAPVWFNANRAGDNYLNASIARNQLTIRPEIGDGGRRSEIAEIQIEFYVSVQAGFEALFGAPIEVTVESGTVEAPFVESLVVAYAWDPITASTSVVTVDDGDIAAAFGLVRAIPVSNIVVTEVEAGVLIAGTRLWVGVEGGISRGWGAADHISLGATHATTNDPNLQLSNVRLDSHGAYVEVIRSSRYDGATITFHGVAVSGRVIPGHQYNIVVGGDAVAANWEEFAWVMGGGAGSLTRGATHGFFADEPYSTPAFTFVGADIAITGPGVTAPQQPQDPGQQLPPTGQLPVGPRTVFQNQAWQTARPGEAPILPAFEMINTYGPGGNASAFLAVAVVRDILGWDDAWDEVARTATFVRPDGVAVVFTQGSATVSVGGVPMTMTNTEGTAIPAQISPLTNRFVVPIRFFNESLGVRVDWGGGTPGNFQLTIHP